MSWRVENAAPITLLRDLPDGWAQTCVTAPPGWRSREGFLGHEPTPASYTLHLVAVLREVRRVLRDDGTLWLNLRDSYEPASPAAFRGTHTQRPGRFLPLARGRELVGLPRHVALALHADGWIAHENTIWTQPATARGDAREYLLLLTKQPDFFYDARALREHCGGPRSGWLRFTDRRGEHTQHEQQRGSRCVRRRSCWQPADGPLTANVPARELIERCILAGTPPKTCGICGSPWVRDTHPRSGGWRASCAHINSHGRALVLDPFAGRGIVGAAAHHADRTFLGIEEHPATARLTRRRLQSITAEARS